MNEEPTNILNDYYDVSTKLFFNNMPTKERNREIDRFNYRKAFMDYFKKNNPVGYEELLNKLSDFEKEVFIERKLSKEKVKEIYKDPRTTKCKSFDRHHNKEIGRTKDGKIIYEPEDGEYTTYNLVMNQIDEKITLLYLNTALHLNVKFNPEATHLFQNTDTPAGANSEPDYVIMNDKNQIEYYIELQTSYCKDMEQFNKRNYETSMNYKTSKFKKYIDKIKNGTPVIHCEKVYIADTNEVKYYFYDMAKIFSLDNKDKLFVTKDNVEQLVKEGKLTSGEEYYFSTVQQGHSRVFMKNLKSDTVLNITHMVDLDIRRYKESVMEALNAKCLRKHFRYSIEKVKEMCNSIQEQLYLVEEQQKLKEIELRHNEYYIENYHEKNKKLLNSLER